MLNYFNLRKTGTRWEFEREETLEDFLLIAIAPSFHRDNLTDRKYHKLEFQFLQFAVIQNADHFYLNLKDIDTQTLSSVNLINL